jgi:hypothetical protein
VSVTPGGRWSRFKTYSTIQRTLEIWGFVFAFIFRTWLNGQKFSYRGTCFLFQFLDYLGCFKTSSCLSFESCSEMLKHIKLHICWVHILCISKLQSASQKWYIFPKSTIFQETSYLIMNQKLIQFMKNDQLYAEESLPIFGEFYTW